MSFYLDPPHGAPDEKLSPPYDEQDPVSSPGSDAGPPPPYDEAVGSTSNSSFTSTTQFHIQATGIGPNNVSFLQPRPEPIHVYRVQPDTPTSSASFQTPAYTSIRLKRSSNSCSLVRGDEPNGSPLIATIYRWGPGRHPRMRIFPSESTASIEEAINNDKLECDTVDVKSRSMFSRTQQIATKFGTFEWRYGSKSERKEGHDANSLLILEKIDQVGKEEKRTRVAQLVRNEEFRTPGTHKYMAGNGGRLMVNATSWTSEKPVDAEMVEAFIVASCVCMLKREVDRMRNNTTVPVATAPVVVTN